MTASETALAWLSPGKPTEHEVNGEKLRFYRLPAVVLIELRDFSKPLIRAFSTLISTTQGNVTERKRTFKTPEKIRLEKTDAGGNVGFEDIAVLDEGNEVERAAISPELAQHRIEQRCAALSEMADVFTDPSNLHLMGVMICNCLRDQFPKRPVPTADVGQFIAQVELPALLQMLMGVVKANFHLFKSLEGKVQAAVNAALAKLDPESPNSAAAKAAAGSNSATTSPTS